MALPSEKKAQGRRHPRLWIPRGPIVMAVEPKDLSPRVRQLVLQSRRPYVTRNSSCPCGSGKRFKRCCMGAE